MGMSSTWKCDFWAKLAFYESSSTYKVDGVIPISLAAYWHH